MPSMPLRHLVPALLLLAPVPAPAAGGAGAAWRALKQEVDALSAQARYDQAAVAARKALALAERQAGPTHLDTATSAEDLALILVGQARYEEAEALHRRALAIRERHFGPAHPEVATSLGNLGALARARGRLQEARPLYEQSLALLEKARGPRHPEVALAANNLGLLLLDLNQAKEAGPLLHRALEIWEAARGPEHPDVATALTNLASLAGDQGREQEAESLERRALAIREKAFGPEHIEVARSLHNLAWSFERLGQSATAEPLHRRALAIREKVLGPEHPEVAASLDGLARLHRGQGRYDLARPLYERALAIVERAKGPSHLETASQLGHLAGCREDQGEFREAEALRKRSLEILEGVHGPEHPKVALAVHDLAYCLRSLGRLGEAEPLFRRAMALWEQAYGPDYSELGAAAGNLAQLYFDQGRFDLAGPLYRRALAIQEKALGLEHPDLGYALNNLAAYLESQGAFDEAEPLYLRALAIVERHFGKEHRHAGSLANNLGFLYHRQGRYEQAAQLFRRSLEIAEKNLGPEHPDVAVGLTNLGGLNRLLRRFDEAEACLRRALAIKENRFGPDSTEVALALSNLGKLHAQAGRPGEAEAVFQRALGLWEQALGPAHPSLAATLLNLADLWEGQGRRAEALQVTRRVTALYRERILRAGTEILPAQESARNREGFFKHLALLSAAVPGEDPARLADESFQVAQLEQATAAGAAVAKMAARFARREDAAAALVRRRQDAQDQRARLQSRLLRASGLPPGERDLAEEARQRAEIQRLGQELAEADRELGARFPDVQALVQAEPQSLAQVQTQLHADEAMLAYSVAEDRAWVWVLRKKGSSFLPLTIPGARLRAGVRAVRAAMEPASPQALPLDLLHELYRGLLAPVAPRIRGVRHLLLVPAGPLQSLPFGMLVASRPSATASGAAYRRVDWFIKHHALSVLPSVGSLRALRRFAPSGKAAEPFIGFGDPRLRQDAPSPPGARGGLQLASLFRGLAPDRGTAPGLDLADGDVLRQQPSLPETAEEIRTLARISGAGPESVWLGTQATEGNVKRLDLSRYRVIAFATHGVTAGEAGAGLEPGLILTPPAQATPEDDGYLSAGEIAQLKLDADWVLLSACNTAAGDGSPGAEGLSGLARAFFYAGSRALLVSHWPVASEATVRLTTEMLRRYQAAPSQGKARAHQQAMLDLMRTPGHPDYAHPFFWAPFVVVGDGGAPSPRATPPMPPRSRPAP
ncbi:MAG: tetratricopeptide repeat protein [Acidobacteria bacterium]|nr:tetratricopeptide repeat protein [Acidobacteriota bacterium]